MLNRTVKYDNATNMFINDEEANRLRSEALRETVASVDRTFPVA
ncbi:MAG: hypothetical protein R3C19_09840 [Planctomycetaceae bacterium]